MLTLSSACQLSAPDTATLLALVANTADAGATAVASIVFASTCALGNALSASVLASGVPILHAPPVAPPVATAWSQGSAVPPSSVQTLSDTAATAPKRHFVRSDAVFSAHDSGLFALIGAAQALLADQQWQRVALLTTADATGVSAVDIVSLLITQTATVAPSVAISAQTVDSAASNMTAAIAALFSVPNPHRVVMIYLPRGLLASAVSALFSASAFGKGYAIIIVAQDAAFDPMWTIGDPAALLTAFSAAPSATVFGGYSTPPLNATQVSAVLSGALIVQSPASLALQSGGSISTFVSSASWLSTVAGTLSNAGKMQLACVHDLMYVAFQSVSGLVGGSVTSAVNNINNIAHGWASSALSRQMRTVSISAGVTGSLSFPMSPSAWLAGWNQSATLSGVAMLNGTSMAAFDSLAFALSATRAAYNVSLVNYVALGVSTSVSQSLSLTLTAHYSLRSFSESAGNVWSSLKVLTSTITRSASPWSPLSWPNAITLSSTPPSSLPVYFVFNGSGPVTNSPSARRYFIALQQRDIAIAGAAVRMAISDGSAFSTATGDTIEFDQTQGLFQDACESTGVTASAQATLVATAVSQIVAVIGCSCSSSSGA